ncbi:MAG: hypothetical protein PVG20_09030 [Thioalkalispiraceae bacterium]|jgi:hypothetical protein
MTSQSNEFIETLRTIGPLRYVLMISAILSLILRPALGVKLTFDGWYVVPNLLVPVLTPILFMLLLLDAMMAMVYRSDKTGAVRARYLRIALINLGLAIGLLVYWLPFIQQLQEAI